MNESCLRSCIDACYDHEVSVYEVCIANCLNECLGSMKAYKPKVKAVCCG